MAGAQTVELAELPNLESLQIENTTLTGPIPSGIFNISSLRIISLTSNKLSGNLPARLCNDLPLLAELLLHRNELTGQIPSSLGRCRELQKLYLSFNKFTGIIPSEIGNLTKLDDLHLSVNNLTGSENSFTLFYSYLYSSYISPSG